MGRADLCLSCHSLYLCVCQAASAFLFTLSAAKTPLTYKEVGRTTMARPIIPDQGVMTTSVIIAMSTV